MARDIKPGDLVAWHHVMAPQAEAIRHTTLPSDSLVGTVKDVANEEGTHFVVAFDDETERTLTFEELIKVVDDREEAS